MVATLAATTIVAGGVAAYAYPPGNGLSVEATASNASSATTVHVTVYNANPACTLNVTVEGQTKTYGPGTFGTPFNTDDFVLNPAIDGRHTVRARLVNCPKGTKKEHAKSRYVVSDANVTGDATSKLGGYYRIDISGLEPDTPVSLMATAPDGHTVGPAADDKADRKGNAKLKVRLDAKGTWSVVVTAQPEGEPSTAIGTLTPTVN